MKILFGKLGHETNTFATDVGDFVRWSRTGWVTGKDIVTNFRGKTDYTSGMMRAAEEYGVDLIPTVAILDAGPLITREALDFAVGTLMRFVEEYCCEIDGICLALHGAGCAEGCDDIESYILRSIRGIVGDEMPITITLDLHANVSAEMCELVNGVFGIKHYPHVDMEEAGHLAMKSLISYIKGEIVMQNTLVRLPLLVPPSAGCTFEMPMKAFMDYVNNYSREHDLIDATFFHGFPFADRVGTGASVVVVSNKVKDTAAYEIANHIWEKRHMFNIRTLSAKEAVDRALEELDKPGTGYVVINETSDNPGGGTPCDGTWLLQELIERNVPKSILGYIHDNTMALKAHDAGVGACISGELGGKTDNFHGKPIFVEGAIVCALSDGNVIYNSPVLEGQSICYGKSARLRIGKVEVVVTEILAQQTLDNVPFLMVGADINRYNIVCVKSSNHFKAYFSSRARAIITADTPGIHTDNLSQLPFKNIRRPIFPLDLDMYYLPE